MNKRFWSVLIFIFITSLQPALVLSDQILIDSDNQFQFAQQYMDKGEYHRAIAEFERLIHFFPKDQKVPMARYLIGLCYLKAKDYDSARKVLEDIYHTYSNRSTAGKALFLIGESYYRQGVSDKAEHYFKKVIDEYPRTELKNAAQYRLGWSRMQENRWREASETFSMVGKNSPFYINSLDLSEKSLDGEHLPYKNPAAAGIMAGIIPGLGHVYSNRYKDGIVAFLLNGLFIWAAVESFDQDHDVLGGVLTFLELGWYSGNIYSAVNCTHKHNRAISNNFRRTLPDTFNLNLFTTRVGHLGLALRINF